MPECLHAGVWFLVYEVCMNKRRGNLEKLGQSRRERREREN